MVPDDRHRAFRAGDREAVDRFLAAARAAGGHDDGGARERPEYHPAYCPAFVRGPCGNRIEAVCHRAPRR